MIIFKIEKSTHWHPHLIWETIHRIEALEVLYTIPAKVNLYRYHSNILHTPYKFLLENLLPGWEKTLKALCYPKPNPLNLVSLYVQTLTD